MIASPSDAKSVLLTASSPGDSESSMLSAMFKKKKVYAHLEKILARNTLKP